MKRKFEIAATFLTVIAMTTSICDAVGWAISNPVVNETYADTSDIGCIGTGDMNAVYVVKLKKGTIVKQSASGTCDMFGMWDHTFEAPSSKWDIGNDWKCSLYHVGEEDSKNFNITNMP